MSDQTFYVFTALILLMFSTKTKNNNNAYVALQVVLNNNEYFTVNGIEGGGYQEHIKNFYLLWTSTFNIYVSNNLIHNCNISFDNINKVNIKYSLSISNIQRHITQ